MSTGKGRQGKVRILPRMPVLFFPFLLFFLATAAAEGPLSLFIPFCYTPFIFSFVSLSLLLHLHPCFFFFFYFIHFPSSISHHIYTCEFVSGTVLLLLLFGCFFCFHFVFLWHWTPLSKPASSDVHSFIHSTILFDFIFAHVYSCHLSIHSSYPA